MGVGKDFKSFCRNLAVPKSKRSAISNRYQLITRRFNLEFWDSDSLTSHSIYTGSFGRATATGKTSDVDMIFWLPDFYYERFHAYSDNGQSKLLQHVKKALQKTYSTTRVGADRQVVVVSFSDGITFEILPAFENTNGSFTFPDSNGGGSWKITNPRPEIFEISLMNEACNGNLKNLCKMARAWKKKWNVPIGGLLIDTLAYNFIRDYHYRDKSFLYYGLMSRDFFDFLSTQSKDQEYWLSPGAHQHVKRKGAFENKARKCKNISKVACSYEGKNYGWTARQKWRAIYGTGFPN